MRIPFTDDFCIVSIDHEICNTQINVQTIMVVKVHNMWTPMEISSEGVFVVNSSIIGF